MVDEIYGMSIDDLLKGCDNPSLYCKYAVFKLAGIPERQRAEVKRRLLEELVNKVNMHFKRVKPRINSLLELIWEALENHYRRSGNKDANVILKFITITRSRTIVNARNDNTYLLFEIGTTLHPILGVPYIPGSCLKGALRSYVSSLCDTSKLQINEIKISDIFGDEEKFSHILVTDAYPIAEGVDGKIVEPEVTTPIYKDSIEEHQAKPTPIIYPVIAEGVKFQFYAIVRKELIKKISGVELSKMVDGWIVTMLKTTLREGIGAKTMLGYGIMEVM